MAREYRGIDQAVQAHLREELDREVFGEVAISFLKRRLGLEEAVIEEIGTDEEGRYFQATVKEKDPKGNKNLGIAYGDGYGFSFHESANKKDIWYILGNDPFTHFLNIYSDLMEKGYRVSELTEVRMFFNPSSNKYIEDLLPVDGFKLGKELWLRLLAGKDIFLNTRVGPRQPRGSYFHKYGELKEG